MEYRKLCRACRWDPKQWNIYKTKGRSRVDVWSIGVKRSYANERQICGKNTNPCTIIIHVINIRILVLCPGV